MPLSPPETSENRVAPSDANSARQRISASSLKTRCAQGNTENVCPPYAWYHGQPNAAKRWPPGFKSLNISASTASGSEKCSNESVDTITSTGSVTCVVNVQ